jgi:hypothetical protein
MARTLGFPGEPRVVVLTLNIALNQKYPLQGLNQKYPLQGKAPRPEEPRPGG